jgi:hypothetical protein
MKTVKILDAPARPEHRKRPEFGRHNKFEQQQQTAIFKVCTSLGERQNLFQSQQKSTLPY